MPRAPRYTRPSSRLHADVAEEARRAAPCAASRSGRRRTPSAARASHLPSGLRRASLASWRCTSRHSVRRRNDTNCARHASTMLAMRQLLRATGRRRTPTARRSDRKSERSSRKRRCAWSAACCLSSGRSRGSGTASALAMTSASGEAARVARREHDAADARIERQARELAARAASASRAASTAPSSCSSW